MKSRRLLPILLIALAALLVGACGKAPLVPDAPKGPTTWLKGIAAACTTSTTDPSGVQVAYQFDWGDGDKSQWSQLMDGGVAFSDTHSYTKLGPFAVKVRAKNTKKASGWSAPLNITVVPSEGSVVWSIAFSDPSAPEDSTDFTLNSFAIGSDNTPYTACGGVLGTVGAVIACKSSGGIKWTYNTADLDLFTSAPVIADSTIYIGCTDDFIYALSYNGAVKWRDSVGVVNATGALAADGTVYFQNDDSMVIALRPDGSTQWTSFTGGGNSAPVVGSDGTVYAINQSGTVYALDQSNGSQKWAANLGKTVTAPPAIDPSRNVLYVVDNETGVLQSVRLADGIGGSMQFNAGTEASGPVVGADGTIYIGGEGKLSAIQPDGTPKWVFAPTMTGVVSTPAITVDGYVYVLVVAGKKRLALQGTDSLYAVNPDGTRHWACGLGEGVSDPDLPLSAPKLDANGFIYIGDGFQGWCVAGVHAPAQSIWPMLQHDAQNTGRAR